jgi:hypothetical protein
MERNNIISKSAYLIYRQCPKYLWYHINDRENIPEPDLRARFNFKASYFTGSLAKKCFPEGIEAYREKDLQQNNLKTLKLMDLRKPLFGAGFYCKSACFFKDKPYAIYARTDILLPAENGPAGFSERPIGEPEVIPGSIFSSNNACLPDECPGGNTDSLKETAVPKPDPDCWDIIEVKITTGIKKINIYEMAFQKYCCQKAGINIRNCYVMNINAEYILKGEIDPYEFFKITEITSSIKKLNLNTEQDMQNIAEIISSDCPPSVNPGKFCSKPFSCPLKKKCWESVSSKSILFLYSINHKMIKKLKESGIESIGDIPLNFSGISEKQKLQIENTKNGTKYIDKGAIATFLKQVSYPVFFLDFETFASPIPLIENTRPYQIIPFQFSLHVLKKPKGAIEHHYFLSDGKSDPRPALLANLRDVFGFAKNHKSFKGTVIVYDESFEHSILRNLVVFDTGHFNWIFKVAGRIVDLYHPFKNFYYYNSVQKGSASVKKVLPALTEKSYEEMAISNGDIAAISFLERSCLWKETTSGIKQTAYGTERGTGSDFGQNALENVCLDTGGKIFTDNNENESTYQNSGKNPCMDNGEDENTCQNNLENETINRETEAVRLNLLEYCKLDTEGLYYIMQELEKLII